MSRLIRNPSMWFALAFFVLFITLVKFHVNLQVIIEDKTPSPRPNQAVFCPQQYPEDPDVMGIIPFNL